jgi:hypothetical protein
MATRSRLTTAALLAASLLLTTPPAAGCNIPVFRYALDHWAADPYRLTLFHRGPLDAAARAALDELEMQAAADFPAVALDTVDLDEAPDGARGVPLPPAGAALPYLVVRYPGASRIDAVVWAGPLAELPPATLLDSPARREIARRIRGGEAAVWVLLAGGDEAKDAAAEALLRAELGRLEKGLKLPRRTTAPEDQLVDEAGRPLRLAFSVLRVDRSDSAEQLLVRMLLNTEDDLPARSDPMVFAVFGRGRVLPALVGAGITPGNVEETADFLVGPCSCQVKRDNPGVDLLMVVDWGAGVSPPPEPVGSAPAPGGGVVPIPAPAAPPPATPPPAPEPAPTAAPPVWPRYALFAGIGVAAATALVTGTMLLRGRRRAST